jgi:TatD DNase family protein
MTNGEANSSFVYRPSSLVDTHCHLDFDRFDKDREAVLARAAQNGVAAIVVPGVDLRNSRAAVALAEKHAPVYAAVGVHPTSTDELDAATLRELRDLAGHPKVVAIGEIGLDYYWPKQPKRDWPCAAPETQRKAFRQQLDLAAETGLPVIIHNREADTDVMIALEDAFGGRATPSTTGVLHSFSGDLELAEWTLELGFYVGITGPVTFPKSGQTKEVAQKIDFERLLIETDAPFLTPHPYRGKRNEPALVRLVAQEIAQLRGCSLEDVALRTTQNAQTLFRRL